MKILSKILMFVSLIGFVSCGPSDQELFEEGLTYYKEGSYSKAIECLSKAAEQGNAEAQCFLGDCYYNGHCVEQNYSKAVEYLSKAAEQGHAVAQLHLGVCYYNGHGVEQNSEKAMDLFRESGAR